MSEKTGRCVCGAELTDVNAGWMAGVDPEERWPLWIHTPGSDTRCTVPRHVRELADDSAEHVKTAAEQMAQLGERTRRAAGELERIGSLLAEVKDDLDALRHTLNAHPTIERAAMTKVWAALVDAGELSGATVVMNLIRAIKQ